jgi:heme-degrading monooxygenase HmoA
MFVVIFEVQPRPDLADEYLKLAQHLKPMLEEIDGFLDVERFASRRTEGRLLSLSTWLNEKALVRWRTHAEHHRVQAKGRMQVFEDYRLRVGEVTADTQPPEGISVEQTRLDETQIAAAKAVTITEIRRDPKRAAAPGDLSSLFGLEPGTAGLVDQEMFASIYAPGKMILLASWRDAAAAQAWRPAVSAGPQRHRHVRIIRDYGMFERREAPQYYPEPARAPASI